MKVTCNASDYYGSNNREVALMSCNNFYVYPGNIDNKNLIDGGCSSPNSNVAGHGLKSVHNSEESIPDQSSHTAPWAIYPPLTDGSIDRIGGEDKNYGQRIAVPAKRGDKVFSTAGEKHKQNNVAVAKGAADTSANFVMVAPKDSAKANLPINTLKSDAPIENNREAYKAKINTTLKNVVKTVSLIIAVSAVLIPVAVALGIPAASLIIVQTTAIAIGVLLSVFFTAKPEKFASIINKLTSSQPIALNRLANAMVGTVAAVDNGAGKAGIKFALGFGYGMTNFLTPLGLGKHATAISNANGAAIGTVDRLARKHNDEANSTIYAGAAKGSVLGSLLSGNIEHSTEVGVSAGTAAFYAARFGRNIDNWVKWVKESCWGLFQYDAARVVIAEEKSVSEGVTGPYHAVQEESGAEKMTEHYIASCNSPRNHEINFSVQVPAQAHAAEVNKAKNKHIPGTGESVFANIGGISGGVYAVADIRTGYKISEAATAFGTARKTVTFGKLLRAVRNRTGYSSIRPEGGNASAVSIRGPMLSLDYMENYPEIFYALGKCSIHR